MDRKKEKKTQYIFLEQSSGVDKEAYVKERRLNRAYRKEHTFPLFRIVLLILLVTCLISFLRFGDTSNMLTFESLLDFLSNVPQVDYGWLSIKQIDLNLPNWLDWLDNVLNFFTGLIEFIGFILAGLWQALTFMLYFLRYLFVS